MRRILVSEEYGYRTWRWTSSMSMEDVILGWMSDTVRFSFFNSSHGVFPGEMRRIDDEIAAFHDTLGDEWHDRMFDLSVDEDGKMQLPPEYLERMNVPENPG